jgi:TPR repeat protein
MKPTACTKVLRRTNGIIANALLIFLAFSSIAQSEPSTNKYPSLAEVRKKWDDISVDKVKQAAESGDLTAQHYLGYICSTGERIAANGTESVAWYERAFGGGYLPSGNNLGVLYFNGGVVTQDMAKAIYYTRLAADKGWDNAVLILEYIYRTGPGAPEDYKESLQWFQRASAQGDALAMFGLYLSFKYGRGVSENEKEATNWLTKAAESGHALAQCELGYYFEHMDWDRFHEISHFRDMRDAVPWYRRSADQGWTDGQYWLGLCYLEGKGVDLDEEKGLEWMRKAADAGGSRPLAKLAELYNRGIGEPRDENDRPVNLMLRAAKK